MRDCNDEILPNPCLRLDYGSGDDWKSIKLGDGTGYYRSDYFFGMFKTALGLAEVLVEHGVELTLKSRHCPHYDANEHTCDVHETRIAELTSERDKWKSCWEKCKAQSDAILAEREQYRKLFGMALDWAHEITMLESSIDEGMA